MKTAMVVATMMTLAAGSAWAEALITADEAKLPAAPSLTMRGVTRGPTVKMVNPAETKSPFDLQIKFEGHGGAAVEPGSLKVTYLKTPVVDLTSRIKPYATAQGISMPKAEVPAGKHPIRIEVKDSEGRVGSAVLELSVGP